MAGLVPVIAISAYVAMVQRNGLAEVAASNLASQAQLKAEAVERILDQGRESIAVLAGNPALRAVDTGATDDGDLLEQLEAFVLFEEVTLVHPRGVPIEATDYGHAGSWAANAAFRGALSGKHVMSPPVFYTGPERLVVEFAAPVYDDVIGVDTRIVAVVVGSLNMDRVWHALDAGVGETGFFAAFDQHGNVIAHPDRELLLGGLEGYPAHASGEGARTVSLTADDGSEMVGQEAPVGTTGWTVAALQSRDEAYALSDQVVEEALIVAALVTGLMVALAGILARAVVSPLRALGTAMQRVAAGDLDQRVDQLGLAEIESLAGSFNVMTEKLRQRSDSLQAEMQERDLAEQRIRYQAYHDPVTGLPNRMLLADRLDMALASAERTGHPLAVMFLDVDRFKTVNDTFGHAHGDVLLQSIADRIQGLIRPGDSLARVGGDEYVLVLPHVGSTRSAVKVADRVLDRLRQPWGLDGSEYRITVSLGIAMYPESGADAETLLRNADTAMYAAKEDGRDGIRVFSPDMQAGAQERVALEQDLRLALPEGQLAIHYQPIVDTMTGGVVSMEALLRWQHPTQGLLPASRFIALAEETGVIWDIGRWVLHEAGRQMSRWSDAGIIGRIPVAVNLSARQFQNLGIVELVRDALASSQLPADRLDLEITESTAMRDIEHSVRVFQELKEMGVRLSVDDFGTGYSSLSYLKRFPIDTVKVDRSFIADVATDQDDATIIGAIVAVAESLGMTTVAEGVETEVQLALLRELRCPSYQGYLFSEPLDADAISALLQRRRPQEPRHHRTAPGMGDPRPAFGT